MKTDRRFSGEVLGTLRKSKSLKIRAGRGTHRFIGIWMVMVEDRVFVRSWSVKPDGWYRAFLKHPRGAMQIGKYKLNISARPIKSKQLRDAIDRAYLEKYSTAWELKYAKDLGLPKSRATTIELVPESMTASRSLS